MSKGIYVGAVLVGISFSLLIAFSGKVIRDGEKPERPVVPELSEFTANHHDTRSALDLWVIADEVSGCQYIFAKFSGSSITPRLGANGKQICRRSAP